MFLYLGGTTFIVQRASGAVPPEIPRCILHPPAESPAGGLGSKRCSRRHSNVVAPEYGELMVILRNEATSGWWLGEWVGRSSPIDASALAGPLTPHIRWANISSPWVLHNGESRESGTRVGRMGTTLAGFQQRHTLRAPIGIPNGQQAQQLTAADGLHLLSYAPAPGVRLGVPPNSRQELGNNRYLWVIDANGIPYICENPIPAIGLSLPKHTNLTGGGSAYLGGELWFTSASSMCVSGGSGRYPPENSNQLEEACDVFVSFNFQVTSLGWDSEINQAMRHLEM